MLLILVFVALVDLRLWFTIISDDLVRIINYNLCYAMIETRVFLLLKLQTTAKNKKIVNNNE